MLSTALAVIKLMPRLPQASLFDTKEKNTQTIHVRLISSSFIRRALELTEWDDSPMSEHALWKPLFRRSYFVTARVSG